MSLLDNLVSYWKLDEASGNALDAHGGNDLAENNTVGSAAGKIGNAREFTFGASEYFSLADNADLSTGDTDWTFGCWVRFPTAGSLGVDCVIAGKSTGTSGGEEWVLRYRQAQQRFRLTVQGGATYAEVDAGSFGAPTHGVWYHVTCWHDAANNQIGIAVNAGTADTAAHSAGCNDGGGPFEIGRYPNVNAQYWEGLIDEAGFWRRVLTSGERTQLYNSGNGLAYEDFGGGGPITVNLGLVSETDLSQAVSRLKTLAVGLNSETGLSQPVIPGREYGLGTTSETDLSQAAASSAKESAIGLNSETDLPQGVSPVRSYGLGPVSETDLSRAVGTMKSLLLGLNAETDSTQGVGTQKSLGTGSTAETDLAQTVTRYSPGTLGVVTETDLSLGVSSRKELGTGLATETDTSLASSPVRAYGLGLGSETDEALSLGQTAKERGLGLAAETDAALGSTIPQEVEVGLVSSVHAALSVSPARRVTLGFVTEADGTFSLGFLKEKPVGMVAETDSARAVTVIGGTLVVGPYYVDAVQVHRAGAVAVQATRAGAVAVQAGVST